jgi:hypothetical protein
MLGIGDYETIILGKPSLEELDFIESTLLLY